jgi:hypothetical protein
MVTKKRARLDIGSDPPIIVGGGGSSLIWINFNENQTGVNPNGVSATAPSPTNKNKYSCSKITNVPVRLFFNDGSTPGPAGEQPLVIANNKRWYIRFAVPGPTARKKAKKK